MKCFDIANKHMRYTHLEDDDDLSQALGLRETRCGHLQAGNEPLKRACQHIPHVGRLTHDTRTTDRTPTVS